MPYDDTYIRQMLMGGQPAPQAPPDVSAMVDATQQQGNPQMPQMMPQLQQQQPMSPQPDQSETRKPGFVKGMLMDFTGTLREALQKEMGVETDEEKKVREFKMRLQTDAAQLAVQKYQQDQQLQTAQMQHADAQSRRADAELQLHKATLAAQLQQKSDAENAGEKLTGEFKAREKQAKSMQLTGQDYVNFVANRDVQKTATDKNPTEASILMDAARGDPSAMKALAMKQKSDMAQKLAGRDPGPKQMVLVPQADGSSKAVEIRPGSTVPREATTVAAMNRADQPTSSTRTMIEAAPKVKYFVDKLLTEVKQQQDQLGPAAGRWNEFMTGKVGAPNAQFTALRTNMGLLTTLLMRMHVGARGGEYIMKHFQDLIDSGKMSPENLTSALNEIGSYAGEIAHEKTGGAADSGGDQTVQPTSGWGSILKKSKKVGKP